MDLGVAVGGEKVLARLGEVNRDTKAAGCASHICLADDRPVGAVKAVDGQAGEAEVISDRPRDGEAAITTLGAHRRYLILGLDALGLGSIAGIRNGFFANWSAIIH